MTTHQRPTKAVRGRQAFVRLDVPIEPNASPRAALEAQAAFLIDLLDRIDGDPDLEPNGDLEPSLAGSSSFELDAEGDESDLEPSLGSLDRAIDQRRWNECEAWHGSHDRELDRCDYEDGHDAESTEWTNPLGSRVDGMCRLIVERVPTKRARRQEVRS